MPGPDRSGQLRRLGGDCIQTEAGPFPHHHADQACPQQDPKAVSHGFEDRGRLRGSVDSLRDFSQNLGSPVFFARNLGKAIRLEQTA